MSVVADSVFADFASFASIVTPEAILAYHVSPATQRRLDELLDENRSGTLTEDQQTELDTYLRFDDFVSMMKIRAAQALSKVAS